MSVPNDEGFSVWEVPFAVIGTMAVGFWLVAVFEYGEGLADLSFVEQIQIILMVSLSMKLFAYAKTHRVSMLRVVRKSLGVVGGVTGIAFVALKLFGVQSVAAWLGVPIIFALWVCAAGDISRKGVEGCDTSH